MYEIFMLSLLLAIGLSHLLPKEKQAGQQSKTKSKFIKKQNYRSDKGMRSPEKERAKFRTCLRNQTLTSRTLTKSSAETGRPNKKPCIW